MSNQFIRKIGLIVSKGEEGIDLSAFRIQFNVVAPDIDSPPTATIRVYNLADATAKRIQDEFQYVSLQAGYEGGNFGIIFQGDLIRIRRGRESNIDTFIEFMASDLEQWFNFAVVNKTVDKGQTQLKNQITTIINDTKGQAGTQGIEQGSVPDDLGTGGTLPRGKVLFGLARNRMTDVSNTGDATWSIVDGKVQFIKLDGYGPNEVVVINAATGMVGIPEATINGIEVTCLLNPLIKTGSRIKLNNSDITTTQTNAANVQGDKVPVGFPNISGIQFYASLSNDGVYRVIVAEFAGDNWANDPWYSKMICLNVDQSAGGGSGSSGGSGVKPYG
jgi:hypothetical protein